MRADWGQLSTLWSRIAKPICSVKVNLKWHRGTEVLKGSEAQERAATLWTEGKVTELLGKL